MQQKWLMKMFWNYFCYFNSIIAIIIIPTKTVIHMASKIGSKNFENQSSMYFYIFGRRFSLIHLTPCFPWWAMLITNSFLAAFACSFWESFSLNFWLVGRLVVAVSVIYALPYLFCFKQQSYIKTFAAFLS